MTITQARRAIAPDATGDASGIELSLVRDDLAYRLQRGLGLIPANGMGTARRALIFAAITWLPLAVWAVISGRGWNDTGDGTLVAHFGVHVRCLVAIPLFIVAEDIAQKSVPPLLGYFVESGLVSHQRIPEFKVLIDGVVRLRNGVLPWVLILGAVIAWASAGVIFQQFEDIAWATTSGKITFGGWWFILVIRPLFAALLLAWLWRACLVFMLTLKLSRFPLSFVPTHPDRVAGLGFFERLAFVFSPVAFAVSAVAAASFAHQVVYHAVEVSAIKGVMIATAILVTVVFLLPLIPLALPLGNVKRQALLDYGTIVGQHGRLVHRRWISDEDIGAPPILDSPELGPVADVQTLFVSVKQMRRFPIGKVGVIAITVPAVLPLLLVACMQLPLQSLLLKVLKTLV